MKKRIAVFLSCLCMAFPATVQAQNNIKVKLDGNYITFSGQKPTVVNNRTLVPLRGIFENLGYTVDWNSENKTAVLKKESKTISIQTGADSFQINGTKIPTDVPAQIINGSLMLPLRAVGQGAGLSVVWDATTKTVIMTTAVNTDKTATDSKEDIQKYVEGYSTIVKKMTSLDELSENMYMVTRDNAEGKLTELISQLNDVKVDLVQAREIHNSLEVPPSMSQLHILCGSALDRLEQLCDVLEKMFNGNITSDEAKSKIDEILEQSKVLNAQISSAVNNLKS